MKKLILFSLFALMSLVQLSAQDEGAKLAKKAAKDLVSYNIDPAGNKAKLQEAKEKIDQAMKLADAQALSSAWLSQGNIYSTLAQQATAMQVVNKSVPLPTDNYALTAFTAFKKAFQMAEKKFEKKDALSGMKEVENNLNIFGSAAYDRKDYANSHASFAATLESESILKAEKETSAFTEPKVYENQMFLTALTASLAGKNDEAMVLYEKLYALGTEEPSVYQGLYHGKMAKGQEAEALKVLSAGRAKFPDDAALLFDEINAYIKQNKLPELIANLDIAIAKEPKNVSLHLTKGNVFEGLSAKSTADKDAAKASEYEMKAIAAYKDALALDPKNATAIYSMGAIPFNKAASLTQEINVLAEKSGNDSKIDKMSEQVKQLFVDALPYFKKAEAVDPNNENTLIALREIYARQDELDLASEFSKRLKVLQEGGKNASSYYKD